MRVCRQAESDGGLLTVRRRRLTACGVPPVGPLPHVFAWCDVDGAVAPTTGARLFLAWPEVHAATWPRLVDACAPAFPDRVNLRRVGQRSAPTARRLRWPAHVRYLGLPPYGPALNPSARVWRDLQDDLAWPPFTELEVPQEEVATVVQADDAPALPSLTGYAYLVEASQALGS